MIITKTFLIAIVLVALVLTPGSTMRVRLTIGEQNQRLLTERELQAFSNVKLMLDGSGEYIYPEANNIFQIPEIHGGVHIIEAISNEYLFPVLVVDHRVEGSPKMKWLNPVDRKMIKVVSEAVISPLESIKYFEPVQGSFLMTFLAGGNGMFILMGVLMVFCYKGLNKLNEAQMAPEAPRQA